MLVSVDKIIVKDRIRKDFGDISELAQDIKENGLINPPVVIPENDGTFTLLAGERRLRALKSLGKTDIEVRTWKALTAEEKLNVEISENEVRKDFSKAERVEYGRRLERIEAAKAKERQGSRTDIQQNFAGSESGQVRDAVASQLGIGSGEQYRKEKAIVDNKELLDPADFADWDEGRLSTNKAFQRVKAELLRRRKENEGLEEDYSRISEKWRQSEAEKAELQKSFDDLQKTLKDSQSQGGEHIRRSALMFNAGMANFLEKFGGYVWLTEHLDEIPDQERKGFVSGINAIYAWACKMKELLEEEM